MSRDTSSMSRRERREAATRAVSDAKQQGRISRASEAIRIEFARARRERDESNRLDRVSENLYLPTIEN